MSELRFFFRDIRNVQRVDPTAREVRISAEESCKVWSDVYSHNFWRTRRWESEQARAREIISAVVIR